ncbi:hypothetical protein GCM10022237_48600 [Nocardioides ginsengisoli]|uniref:Terminase small subunit n=1 Tax=Nocardioides ginsengisoli TaxID=363868 RepID=A0ABW3W428_9ACTN
METENGDLKADDKAAGPGRQGATESLANGDLGAAEGDNDSDQGETFTRAYVEELRRESAKHRNAAKRTGELTTRLVHSYVETLGRLHDARDLPLSDELMDEDGFPDREKIATAVEELVKQRPHLARIRPLGDVGQGASESTPSDLSAFGSFLRN